ncbi:peptidoglycan DD-metalloendopeptidase family protein [Thioalkalivibrio sp.]|uniref:peptidoglycan DD-metalloendopeptidase family protein n=1 Tax=Thioalkalivibrio sp. TaxID=2093813 RepID=UPI0039752D5B
MRSRPLVLWLTLALLMAGLAGCAARPPAAPGDASVSGTYVVQRNETLYRIATRHGLDWRDVARRNGIGPPYLIYPGQRLRLSGARSLASRPAPVPSPSASAAAPSPASALKAPPRPETPSNAGTGDAAPAVVQPPARPAPGGGTVAARGPLQWQWPVDGPLLRPFSNNATTRRGIAIGGSRGDAVRAATDGEVVYAGSGLVGYGRLIIVKHDARFISAYGHNEELLVREGQNVRAGQRIALLGDSGADRPMLHFEIRVDGAPVDPTRYLPRR